ncbi:hypothetical protein FACS189413_04410 [Bacteroidia bacterium]|nr:hypothetical protein FACS189413_04410 [Bacteroidia bacterium]
MSIESCKETTILSLILFVVVLGCNKDNNIKETEDTDTFCELENPLTDKELIWEMNVFQGKIKSVSNPCTTIPCLPGRIYAIEVESKCCIGCTSEEKEDFQENPPSVFPLDNATWIELLKFDYETVDDNPLPVEAPYSDCGKRDLFLSY